MLSYNYLELFQNISKGFHDTKKKETTQFIQEIVGIWKKETQ